MRYNTFSEEVATFWIPWVAQSDWHSSAMKSGLPEHELNTSLRREKSSSSTYQHQEGGEKEAHEKGVFLCQVRGGHLNPLDTRLGQELSRNCFISVVKLTRPLS